MPAARLSSSKSRKSKNPGPHSTSKPTSKPSASRPNGTKRVACHAWWCDSTFSRRADMLKHVGLEHFGKRAYCTLCGVVMKQDSNMSTHLNAHVGNQCTLCSCGQGFTDPSAYTRHREATGHEKGSTHGKVRPTVVKPVKVQHVAGLLLNLEMISDPSFVPPAFDESFYRRGLSKPKGQEKYSRGEYVILHHGVPIGPSAQEAGILLTDGAPAAEYRESVSTEPHAPAHTEIQMDKLGLNVEFSYDVELEPQYSQGISPNAYNECHGSSATHNIFHPQPSEGYYTPPEAIPFQYSYPTAAPHMAAYDSFHPHQYQGSYPMGVGDYSPVPPHSFTETHIQPEYSEVFYPSQVPNPHPLQISPPSLDTPHHDLFGEMGFGMAEPEPFQQPHFQPFYHPDAHFNHMYQSALTGY